MYPFTAELRLVLLATILATTLIGWLALWAGAGRFRWYWHVTPLAVALTALVPMGGRDPLLLFGVQAGTILICEVVRKRSATPRDAASANSSMKFGLGDAITAIALIGILLAILRIRPVYTTPHHTISVSRWTYSGSGLGFATLAGAALVMGTDSIWRRVLVATLFMIAAATFLLYNDLKEAAFPYSLYGASGIQWSYDWVLALVPAQVAATAAWLALLKGAAWAWWAVGPSVGNDDVSISTSLIAPRIALLSRFVSRVAVVLSTFWLVWITVTVYWEILPPFSMPAVTLPTPNGADDVLLVNRRIKWNSLPSQDVSLASDQQCGQFAADNQQQLEQIRVMLTKPWWHAVDYADFNNTLAFVHAVRDLSSALWADARAQAAQGRYDLAARDYLDMVLLANLSTRGGTSIDEFTALGVCDNARSGLIDHLERFDPQTLREIAYSLEILDGTQEPIEELQARDELHTAINSSWVERLVNLAGRVSKGPGGSHTAHFRARSDAKLRLIAIEAALRAYVADHGSLPDALAALVPQYFTILPLDPFCRYEDATFVYRRDGDRYLLYSLGIDGYDDGGLRSATPDPQRGEKRDLFFDSTLP